MFNIKRKKMIEELSREQQPDLKTSKTVVSEKKICMGKDMSDLINIQSYLYEIREEILDEAGKVDWDQNTFEIMRKARVLEAEKIEAREGFFSKLFTAPHKLGLATAAAAFLFLGFMLIHFIERNGLEDDRLIVPADSVERMEKTLAKNETVEYLQQSSIILSSVANMTESKLSDSALRQNAEYAKNLLLKKKYINKNLSNYELANAQSVCNQVEYLLYDISQIKNPSDVESLNNLKNIIQNKKIMLKIKLVQSELVNSEV